jgi:Fur family transcriptional regulator, ferric uptake regulator
VSLPSVSVSQSPEGRFREYLASRPEPKRFTTQQRELLEHIFARHKHFDANELIDDLKAASRPVSRATVYRTLTLLVDAGLLKRIEVGSRTVYDHDYGYPEHDHFVCEQCGAMIEFAHPRLDEVLREAAADNQFRATAHSLVIRGTCAACDAARASKRRLVM